MQPLVHAEFVGAISGLVLINNCIARAIFDTGSGVSLLIEEFVQKYSILTNNWNSQILNWVTGERFRVRETVIVEMNFSIPV